MSNSGDSNKPMAAGILQRRKKKRKTASAERPVPPPAPKAPPAQDAPAPPPPRETDFAGVLKKRKTRKRKLPPLQPLVPSPTERLTSSARINTPASNPAIKPGLNPEEALQALLNDEEEQETNQQKNWIPSARRKSKGPSRLFGQARAPWKPQEEEHAPTSIPKRPRHIREPQPPNPPADNFDDPFDDPIDLDELDDLDQSFGDQEEDFHVDPYAATEAPNSTAENTSALFGDDFGLDDFDDLDDSQPPLARSQDHSKPDFGLVDFENENYRFDEDEKVDPGSAPTSAAFDAHEDFGEDPSADLNDIDEDFYDLHEDFDHTSPDEVSHRDLVQEDLTQGNFVHENIGDIHALAAGLNDADLDGFDDDLEALGANIDDLDDLGLDDFDDLDAPIGLPDDLDEGLSFDEDLHESLKKNFHDNPHPPSSTKSDPIPLAPSQDETDSLDPQSKIEDPYGLDEDPYADDLYDLDEEYNPESLQELGEEDDSLPPLRADKAHRSFSGTPDEPEPNALSMDPSPSTMQASAVTGDASLPQLPESMGVLLEERIDELEKRLVDQISLDLASQHAPDPSWNDPNRGEKLAVLPMNWGLKEDKSRSVNTEGKRKKRLDFFLSLMMRRGSQDLHLHVGQKPMIREDGNLIPMRFESILQEDWDRFVEPICPPGQWPLWLQTGDVDFIFEHKEIGKMRVSLFRQRGGASAIFQMIPEKIQTLEELGLPTYVEELADLREGLCLLVGLNGSGISTTASALLEQINQNQGRHIVTIEDPIEFVYTHQKSIIQQREIGVHAHSLEAAMSAVLRERPDVLFVSDLVSKSSIIRALEAAEMGTLVIAVVQTRNAQQAFQRFLEAFEEREHEEIRERVSQSLSAVLTQQLVRTQTDALIPVVEFLLPSIEIRNAILYDEMDTIAELVHRSEDNTSISAEKHIVTLYDDGILTEETIRNTRVNQEWVDELLLEEEPEEMQIPEDLL